MNIGDLRKLPLKPPRNKAQDGLFYVLSYWTVPPFTESTASGAQLDDHTTVLNTLKDLMSRPWASQPARIVVEAATAGVAEIKDKRLRTIHEPYRVVIEFNRTKDGEWGWKLLDDDIDGPEDSDDGEN